MHIIRLLAVALGSLLATEAFAQCTKDTDCKGDRVCVRGECQDPAVTPAMTPEPFPGAPAARSPAEAPLASQSVTPDAEPMAAPQLRQTVHADPGWATGAGIVGFGLAGLGLSLALGSEATRGDDVPSMSLGAVAALCLAVGVPIVAGGGSSARGDERVRGSGGLRVGGWITYSLGLVMAASLLVMGLAEVSVPAGVITLTGLMGAGSLCFFAIDALASAGQARALGSGPEVARRPTVSIAPLVALGPDSRGGTAGRLGLAGRF